jgi:hypothetical protein
MCRRLATVLVSLAVSTSAGAFVATPALGAASTSYSPATVNLTTGESAMITVAALGLTAGDAAAQFGIVHNAANTRITNPQCAGVFAGATPFQQAVGFGDLLACAFITGGASGATGNVMRFTLTNTGGAIETITFNPGLTFYLGNDNTRESPGSLNRLVVTNTLPLCILGDINCDEVVDIRDYGLWRQHFGESVGAAAPNRVAAAGLVGDLNGDGIVDIRDYGIWRANFGHTASAARRAVLPVAPPIGTPTPPAR